MLRRCLWVWSLICPIAIVRMRCSGSVTGRGDRFTASRKRGYLRRTAVPSVVASRGLDPFQHNKRIIERIFGLGDFRELARNCIGYLLNRHALVEQCGLFADVVLHCLAIRVCRLCNRLQETQVISVNQYKLSIRSPLPFTTTSEGAGLVWVESVIGGVYVGRELLCAWLRTTRRPGDQIGQQRGQRVGARGS